MRKLFLSIAVFVMALCANAQTNQYFWYQGNLMMGNPIAQIDSVTFGNEDTDSIMIYLPRKIIKEVHDTIYITIHDTVCPESYYAPQMVDLGLPSGLKWADCNVGAHFADDYGFYCQWGCVDEIVKEGWAIYCHGQKNALTKYCTNASYGIVDNLTTLEAEDDMATTFWGNGWRTPTEEEARELWNNCTKTWEDRDNISGYKFTGPNGNSIFLPANGWYDEQGGIHTLNEDGLYWTSSLYTSDNNSAWGLITRKTTGNAGVLMGSENRNYARCIRAVHQ